MTNIDKQALREAAQEEITLRYVGDASDAWQDEASPEAVLALLDELEAAEKLATQQGNIAVALLDEVTTLRRNADDKAPELRAQLIDADNELDTLRQRIAELEARTVTLPPKEHDNGTDSQIDINAGFANRMWQKCADAIRAAGIGVKGE